jgi:predicted small secreted protein
MRMLLLVLAALLLAGCEHMYGAGDVRVTDHSEKAT